jgi:hypothetical protein
VARGRSRAGAIDRNAGFAAAIAEARAANADLLDTGEVAALLGVDPSIVSVCRRHGLIPAVEIGGRPLYARAAVDSFVREKVKSDDGRALLWFDPEHVVKCWRARGALERLARSRGLTEREAEAVVRSRVKDRRELLRHRTGRNKASYYAEWRETFARMKPEPERPPCEWAGCAESATRRLALGRGALGCYCGDHASSFDAPAGVIVTERDAALSIAEAHWREHPEHWKGYPADPRDPTRLHPKWRADAIKRVLKAVRPAAKVPAKAGETTRAA